MATIWEEQTDVSTIWTNQNVYVNPDEGYDALRDVYDYLIYDSNDELIYTLLEDDVSDIWIKKDKVTTSWEVE